MTKIVYIKSYKKSDMSLTIEYEVALV